MAGPSKRVIAKSDVVILALASVTLAASMYRWYQNTQDVDAVTIPASARLPAAPDAPRSGEADKAFDSLVEIPSNRRTSESPDTRTIALDATTGVSETPLPTRESNTATSVSPDSVTAEEAAFGVHTVESGEYLGLIANRYGTTVSRLQSLNGLQGTTILVGQELLYPRSE